MHTHFDSCGLDAKGYRARLAQAQLVKAQEREDVEQMEVAEDSLAVVLMLGL